MRGRRVASFSHPILIESVITDLGRFPQETGFFSNRFLNRPEIFVYFGAHDVKEEYVTMQLIVNGASMDHPDHGSLLDLIAGTGARPERTAVMVNGSVVKRVDWDRVRLKENDCVEVLMFAGGG